jgi:hypothetical protein
MRFRDFDRAMKKGAFTLAEAAVVAAADRPAAIKLQLHRWAKAGDLVRIRREVYAFPGRSSSLPEMIHLLYPPAYVSLESALNHHGILPDVPFETTLVTPRATRSFQTPWGRFHFHKIQQKLFFGYDSATLWARPEKAILDYLYFHRSAFHATRDYWREARFQNLRGVDWRKGDQTLPLFDSEPVNRLWRSLKSYAKTQRSH